MVKLLTKRYAIKKANKNHVCNYCDLTILKGVLYRKYDTKTEFHKLHEYCYLEISISSIKQFADNIEKSNKTLSEGLDD